jgi:hypothetical protein
MNEITRIPNNNTALSTRGPRAIDQVVLVALKSDIARKAQTLLSEIWSVRSRGCSGEPGGQAFRIAEHRRVVAMAEPILASPEYKALVSVLEPAVELATLAQIKREIGGLIACFPSQADVSVFVAFAVEEVATELPTVYALVAACRELRCTKTFRPSIAEILEALQAKQGSGIRYIVEIVDEIQSMRSIASEGEAAAGENAP